MTISARGDHFCLPGARGGLSHTSAPGLHTQAVQHHPTIVLTIVFDYLLVQDAARFAKSRMHSGGPLPSHVRGRGDDVGLDRIRRVGRHKGGSFPALLGVTP